MGTVSSAESPSDGTLRTEIIWQDANLTSQKKKGTIDLNIRGEPREEALKCFSLSPRPPPRRLKSGSSSCGSSPASFPRNSQFLIKKGRFRKFGKARSASYDSPMSSPLSAKRGVLPSISAPLRPDAAFITLSTFVMPTTRIPPTGPKKKPHHQSDGDDVQLTPGVLENPTPMSHNALRKLMMSPKQAPRKLGDVSGADKPSSDPPHAGKKK